MLQTSENYVQRRHKYKMRAKDLQNVMSYFNFAPHTKYMLNQVFVHKRPIAHVAEEMGSSKQFLWARVSKVAKKAQDKGIKYQIHDS